MKNPIFVCLLFCTLLVSSQSERPAPSYSVVTDTLHYYLNKYFFTHGSMNVGTYPIYRAPHTGTASPNPEYIGVRFENSDTVIVKGVEGILGKGPVTINFNVPIRLYLCSLDVSGKPVLPGMDSVSISLGSSSIPIKSIGGNFVTSHTLTSDFAVLFKNMSTDAGDTVFVAHNGGVPPNSTTGPASRRFSDGNYAYIRHQGQFYSTLNYTTTSGFGNGTEYEFMLAPRVQYRIQASHKIPQIILDANQQMDTICTRTNFTFTNTSSYFFTNRFYNLMEFQRKWSLYAPFVTAPQHLGWPSDSAIYWVFEYDLQPPIVVDPRKYLPYKHQGQNHQSITTATDRPGCFSDNEFRALLKRMAPFGRGTPYSYVEKFKICQKYCFGDVVGIQRNGEGTNLKVFPNPGVDNKIVVTGLETRSRLKLLDPAGRTLAEFYPTEQQQELDMSPFSKGTYLLLIENEGGQKTCLKIIH